ncbi:hypothetical protein KY331_05135 [Candidatus Woesearchaeota archaeon]|nr:hypothetical protein [Candidatus Woesearchaeota archaeon]
MQIKPESGAGKPVEEKVEKPVEEKPTPVFKPTSTFDMKKVAIFAAVIVGVLVIGLLAYFMFRGPAEISEKYPILITDLLLASSVDEDYNYVEKIDSTYTKGENIIIYHEIKDITPKDVAGELRIRIREVHQLFDPDGLLVPGLTEVNSFSTTKTVTTSDLYTIPVESGVNTAALSKPGDYIYRITVIDQFNLTNTDTKEIEFNLEI